MQYQTIIMQQDCVFFFFPFMHRYQSSRAPNDDMHRNNLGAMFEVIPNTYTSRLDSNR